MNIDPTTPLTAQLRPYGLAAHCAGDTALLYRFRDIEGALIYVGVTVNPIIRWQAHRNRASWWPSVASVDVEEHPHMNAALDAELAAIRHQSPRFNLRSVAERPVGDSTPSRGTSPQGKGREGIRKGSGTERFRDVVCGVSGSNQIQSHRYLPSSAAPIGLGAKNG